MNWKAIGAIGEIVGAIAVVLTLFHLADPSRPASRITKPPVVREDAPIKLSFRVDDIERARPMIQRLGGDLKESGAAWAWRETKHLDGWGPEGNVIQMRQREA